MFEVEVIFVTAFLAILAIFVGFLIIDRDENKGLKKRIDALVAERTELMSDREAARSWSAVLAGELSMAQNTLALVQKDVAATKSVEPVKAKTGAEVRKAVERRNSEETEKND